MKNKRFLSLLLASVILLSGCNAGKAVTNESTAISGVTEETVTSASTESSQTETTASEPFEFNPHVYSGKIAERVPQDHWDAFYNLCDALRKGEDSFKCTSQEAFKWATDASVLCNFFPAAGAKVEALSFEDGTGKVRYNMPVEDFLKRESDFEVLITDILNTNIEKDDTEYERALKLYLYVANNYVYDNSLIENLSDDNFVYACFMEKKGQCVNFASVYAYLLLQAGIDAVPYSIYEPDMCHSWTYAVINGKGYHFDTTWALKADGIDGIYLDYFMMSAKEREADGCNLKDPTVTLLPEYSVNDTNVKFDATDSHYCIRDYCKFVSLDEEKKIVHYNDLYNEPKEFCYGD